MSVTEIYEEHAQGKITLDEAVKKVVKLGEDLHEARRPKWMPKWLWSFFYPYQ